MTQADGDWLSTKEAASALGLTPRTLYRLIDEGQLPAYRFGRVIRLKQTEIDSFVDNSRIEPGELEHLYPEAAPNEQSAEA
ncbi:MAG: excisionase family DNA binding protein [Verrucomicrobiales bacterium]|jgi:excisionase family DNA binding protein